MCCCTMASSSSWQTQAAADISLADETFGYLTRDQQFRYAESQKMMQACMNLLETARKNQNITHIMEDEEVGKLPFVPPPMDWQTDNVAALVAARNQWEQHSAARTGSRPQSSFSVPQQGPRPPPEVLGSKTLYEAWRQRCSKHNCKPVGMNPLKHVCMIRGRPTCLWVLSHLEAPIVEWDSYFATVFSPLVPRVIYGMTAGQVKGERPQHCVMNAWKVAAFNHPSLCGAEGACRPCCGMGAIFGPP